MFRDVDQELALQELLQDVLGSHVHQALLGGRSHPLLDHDDGPRDVLLLHPGTVRLDGLDADLGVVREEDEHLICGIIIVSHRHYQVTSGWSSLAGLVSKLLLKQRIFISYKVKL